MNDIKFIPIGGMDEKGKNLYILEVNKEIFIFDCGGKNPSFQNFGVDLIIPNFDYLVENKNKIKGLFISNGHPENIGSISYLIKKMPHIPIYGSGATLAILENEFRKMKVSKFQLNELKSYKDIAVGQAVIKPFQVGSHFIGALGFAICIGKEQIIYAVDYQMHDDETNKFYASDFKRINEIARSAKTIALISESSKIREANFSASGNTGIINGFKEIIKKDKKQQILVGAFYGDIKSVQNMIEFAIENDKKIVIYGRALNETLKYMKAKQLINLPDKSLISFTKIQHHDNYVIFACHTSYNLYRLLSGIIKGEDEFVSLTSDMEVFVAAWPIPGAETFYYTLIDSFYKLGIRAKYVDKSFIKGAGPFRADVEYMLKTFKPANLISIKGHYRDLTSLNEFAKEFGIKDINTTLIDNGEKIAIEPGKVSKIKGRISIVDSIVDGYGIGDVGASILNERVRMGDSGAVFIGVMLKAKNKQLINKPTIELIGLTENPEYIALFHSKLDQLLEEILPANEKDIKKFDIKEVKQIIRKKITNLCRRKLNKEPAVVPVIIEVR